MGSKETNLPVADQTAAASLEEKQRRRMLVALALLLIALIVVLIKDRQYWFSSSQLSEPAATEAGATPSPAVPPQGVPVATLQSSSVASTAKVNSKKGKGKIPGSQAPPSESSESSGGPVITATNRTVLPPLEIEVVAGNQHRPLSSSNNSVKVDMESSAASAPPPSPSPSMEGSGSSKIPDTSAQVTVPAATAERVTHSVRPDYPLLAKQMKVQGAVVLQALIDKAGRIEELHVVTGPAILASAAQEAVKQWRFKPYYQQGQAVETEARITVNFTISTY